ncbi:MAG: ATP-grasp domain-containing protein [Candidatus Helarchaeota archaeon]
MDLFIFEYITGGGFIDSELPATLACEGAAMLISVIKGLVNSDINIKILLDERLSIYNDYFKNVSINIIKKGMDFHKIIYDIVNNSDYYLITAPEFDNILKNLTEIAETTNSINLGSDSKSIEITTDKFQTYNYMKNLKDYIPKTHKVNIDESVSNIDVLCKDLSYPVVFKPVDGVGGEGINLIREKSDIKNSINNLKTSTSLNEFIIQEYIKGTDVSVSFFIHKKKIYPLTLNYQMVEIKPPPDTSEYKGGYIPFKDVDIDTSYIFDIGKKCIENIPGLNGYVGIDFVLKDRPYIMEINPRLTSSYVGLRELLDNDLYMQVIHGYDVTPKIKKDLNVFFKKINFKADKKRLNILKTKKDSIMKYLITPLFKFNNEYYGFILLKSKNLNDNLEKLNKLLKDIVL